MRPSCLRGWSTDGFQRAVIIAMIAVRVVQSAGHQIVHMVAVRHGRMSAIRAMNVFGRVSVRTMSALVGVGFVHFDHVLVNMVPVHVMQVPVVEIIRVTCMFNRRMATTGAMLVSVICVLGAIAHIDSLHLCTLPDQVPST